MLSKVMEPLMFSQCRSRLSLVHSRAGTAHWPSSVYASWLIVCKFNAGPGLSSFDEIECLAAKLRLL